MATFCSNKTLFASTSLIPAIADCIRKEFLSEGYDVTIDALSSGGYDISITKGGLFKAVLGMRTALKVLLLPRDGNVIYIEAGVGIWGQQAIPTVISMLFFWPVLITQIWGMIEQSKLDDKVLDIAEKVTSSNSKSVDLYIDSGNKKFCTSCGAPNDECANFCCKCGKPF